MMKTTTALLFALLWSRLFAVELPFDRARPILQDNDVKLVPDENGPLIEAADADQDIATVEFCRAMHALRQCLGVTATKETGLIQNPDRAPAPVPASGMEVRDYRWCMGGCPFAGPIVL